MTAANSFTGVVNCDDFETVESLITGDGSTFSGFTSGKTYTMQIINHRDTCVLFKISDAIFSRSNQIFEYTATSDDLYINTQGVDCTLTILEMPSA